MRKAKPMTNRKASKSIRNAKSNTDHPACPMAQTARASELLTDSGPGRALWSVATVMASIVSGRASASRHGSLDASADNSAISAI